MQQACHALCLPFNAEQEILETMLHELAHCRWRNHSDHFWRYMAQLGRVRRAGTLTGWNFGSLVHKRLTASHGCGAPVRCPACSSLSNHQSLLLPLPSPFSNPFSVPSPPAQDLKDVKAGRDRFPGGGRKLGVGSIFGLLTRLPGAPVHG